MITHSSLGLKHFGRKTKPSRPTTPFPLELKFSTAHQRLRSDPGGEFTSNHQFTAYLQQQGTERRPTMDNTLRHNSVAESLNRRLMERTRAFLHQASLPKHLWAKAIYFAVCLKIVPLLKHSEA